MDTSFLAISLLIILPLAVLYMGMLFLDWKVKDHWFGWASIATFSAFDTYHFMVNKLSLRGFIAWVTVLAILTVVNVWIHIKSTRQQSG